MSPDLTNLPGEGDNQRKFTITYDATLGSQDNTDSTPYLGHTYYINSDPTIYDTPYSRDTVDHIRCNPEISAGL